MWGSWGRSLEIKTTMWNPADLFVLQIDWGRTTLGSCTTGLLQGSSSFPAMPSNFSHRSQRKKQTRLAFDPVELSSPSTMSPARMRYRMSRSPSKAFDLTSPGRTANNTENGLFSSNKRYAVVIETPKKQKKDGRLPFKPLATPAESSNAQVRSMNTAGEPPSYLAWCILSSSDVLSCDNVVRLNKAFAAIPTNTFPYNRILWRISFW